MYRTISLETFKYYNHKQYEYSEEIEKMDAISECEELEWALADDLRLNQVDNWMYCASIHHQAPEDYYDKPYDPKLEKFVEEASMFETNYETQLYVAKATYCVDVLEKNFEKIVYNACQQIFKEIEITVKGIDDCNLNTIKEFDLRHSPQKLVQGFYIVNITVARVLSI